MDYCKSYPMLKDEENIYKEISYLELIDMFNDLKSGFVYIGSPSCKNCIAIIDRVNTLGKNNKLDVIYNYNPKFINVFNEEEDLRDCLNLDSKLQYYKLIEKIGFMSDELVKDTLIPRIHIPFFMVIKNGICIDYYSEDLIMDKYLHKEDSDINMDKEFNENINDLMKKI